MLELPQNKYHFMKTITSSHPHLNTLYSAPKKRRVKSTFLFLVLLLLYASIFLSFDRYERKPQQSFFPIEGGLGIPPSITKNLDVLNWSVYRQPAASQWLTASLIVLFDQSVGLCHAACPHYGLSVSKMAPPRMWTKILTSWCFVPPQLYTSRISQSFLLYIVTRAK